MKPHIVIKHVNKPYFSVYIAQASPVQGEVAFSQENDGGVEVLLKNTKTENANGR